ncbi:MAG: hypothetical protein BGP04_13160 [Rhizobiales bacterium 62-17]|nr:MAG: hypothetical protein BGP04_13160 [Rhizobiales bacterium 62-17]
MLTGIGLALFSMTCLAIVIVSRCYFDYAQTQRNHDHLRAYILILEAANVISAERGPANTSMSVAPGDPTAAESLAAIRARSDRALANVAALSGEYAIPSVTVDETRALLIAGRKAVDQVSATPHQNRTISAIKHAVDSMFAVIDRLGMVRDQCAEQMIRQDAGLAGPAIIGRNLGEMREYAGRLGSLLHTPMAAGVPVPNQTLADIYRTEGRITALWQTFSALPGLAQSQFQHDKLDVDQHFFKDAFALIHTLIAEGERGTYPITSPEFTARYVPTMRSLETLRASYLEDAVLQAARARDQALSMLLIAILATSLIIALLIGIIVIIRRQVFRPLIQAQQAVFRLAEDKLERVSFPKHHTREMAQLFIAISGLRTMLVERKTLTQRLQQLAETDSLTGLANRRLLDLIGQGLDNRQLTGIDVGLILLDIDHFKAVNDTHGHMMGDQVLVEMANLLRTSLRSNDLIARYGGEEFAILVHDGNMSDLLALARKIRLVVQTHLFGTIDETPLRLTVSCGAAQGQRTKNGWSSLVQNADAALYRAKAEGRNNVRYASESEKKASIGDTSEAAQSASK